MHVWVEDLGNNETLELDDMVSSVNQAMVSREKKNLCGLIILDEAAKRPLRRTEGAVEHMNINFACLVLALQATTNFKPPTLCHRISMLSNVH